MAKEVVITSVPRGVKLGRTGFQAVMRTAGVTDGVLTSLEQLAGYRHVHPQGSGRNPVIYAYRSVRGSTGPLTVLSRTVDSGNDFSNRSNKLAHLLVVEPLEMPALRNSSPAVVLSAIDSRLATTWQAGPEERPSPFALPAPPVQPMACRRWQMVKGDGGWGGLLAQRAARGQASLLIAPDCSPEWSRTLLELFAEALALLPPDSRWRTTFETTVIGPSASLLRGTYAGSPESAAGHAGLLLVDLSQRGGLPANVAVDEFITIAREGPKQPTGQRPPRIPGGPPVLTSGTVDSQPVPSGAGTSPGPSGPPRAPGRWEDDDEPKSRLGWYIFGGVLLFGLLMAGAVAAALYWWDGNETQRLQNKIFDYARIAGGKGPPSAAPTPEEWKRAFCEDNAPPPDSDVFQLLLSALRTKKIGSDDIHEPGKRSMLVEACIGLQKREHLLHNAETLGCQIPSLDQLGDQRHRELLDTLVKAWLDRTYGQKPIPDIAALDNLITNAAPIVAAAFSAKDSPDRQNITQQNIAAIYPGAFKNAAPEDVEAMLTGFRLSIRPPSTAETDVLAYFVRFLDDAKPEEKGNSPLPPQGEPPDRQQRAEKAAQTLFARLREYKQRPVTDCRDEIPLASGVNLEHLELQHMAISLPTCGSWSPQAEPATHGDSNERRIWKLKGLPDDQDIYWGTVTLDRHKGAITFKPEANQEAHDHLFVPLIISLGKERAAIVLAKPETVRLKVETNAHSIYELFTCENPKIAIETDPPVTLPPSLLESPNIVNFDVIDPTTEKRSTGFHLMRRSDDPARLIEADLMVRTRQDEDRDRNPVWLDAINCELVAELGKPLQCCITRDGLSLAPWEKRVSRNGKISMGKTVETGECIDLAKTFLDESRYDDLKTRPKNELSKPAVTKWLEYRAGTAENSPDRQAILNNTVNTIKKEGLKGWRDAAFDFLIRPHGTFRELIRQKTVDEIGDPPEVGPPPAKPPQPATLEQKTTYEAKQTAWDKKRDASENWKKEFDARLYSHDLLYVYALLDSRKVPPEDATAAMFVLEVDAYTLLEGDSSIPKSMKQAMLPGVLQASVELSWSTNGETRKVPRLIIEPSKDTPTE